MKDLAKSNAGGSDLKVTVGGKKLEAGGLSKEVGSMATFYR